MEIRRKPEHERARINRAIWLMLIPISVFAGIWWDDFEDGRADGWSEVSGDWEVTDGTYQQTTMDAVYQKSLLELEDLSDFTLEVEGPAVPTNLAVEPVGKLAAAWGIIKMRN